MSCNVTYESSRFALTSDATNTEVILAPSITTAVTTVTAAASQPPDIA